MDATGPHRLPRTTIARDASLLALTAALWWLERDTRAASGVGPLAIATAAGVFAAIAGFLFHEWGHLAGARLAGSFVHYPNRLLAPLLFHFDTAKNDRRQFLWMSYGGYAASALGLVAIAALVPFGAWSGQLALGLVTLGVVATLVAEVPITVRVLRGAPLPTGFAYQAPSAR